MVDSVTKFTYTWGSSTGTSDFCGNPNPVIDLVNTNFKDEVFSLDLRVPHTAQTLSLKMISTLDSLSGSWGIR